MHAAAWAIVAALDGTWQGPCVMAPEDPESFERLTITVTAGAYDSAQEVFSGAACEAGTLKHTMSTTSAYTLADSPTVAGAQNLDLTLDHAYMTVTKPEIAANLSRHAFCGYAEWTLGVAYDVTGRTCRLPVRQGDGSTVTLVFQFPAAAAKFYGLVKAEAERVWFGQGDAFRNGTTPRRRAARLSETSFVRIAE